MLLITSALRNLDGLNVGDHIHRMLPTCLTDKAALKFTFYGYGPSAKRPKAKAALRKKKLMKCIFGNYVANGSDHTLRLFTLYRSSKKWTATEKENEMKVRDWLKHTKDRISALEVQAEEEMDWSEN